MARIEIDGIYKHAPLTEAQISGTKRNLDREIIIKTEAIASRASLLPVVTDEQADANAYPSSYIYAMDYDSTDHGGDNDNIRRHIPTLELLGSKGSVDANGGVVGSAGSSWINIETTGSYTALTGGQTLQDALEALDSAAAGAVLQHLIDGPEDGSLTSSIDGATPSGTNTGGAYQTALGSAHVITDSYYSAILGGETSSVIDATNSVIVSGHDNKIETNTDRAFIGAGNDNYITNIGGSAFIGVGQTNKIENGSINSFIGGGNTNYIHTNAQQSAILAGDHNTISDSSNQSFVGAGNNNYINGNSGYAAIVSGVQNAVTGSYHSGIFVGYNNIIYDGNDSAIIGGNGNYIDAGYSFIGTGDTNKIDGSDYSTITAGARNNILNNSNGAIIGAGTDNDIDLNAYYSIIGAGTSNLINNDSYGNGILSGNGNSITNGTTYAIIGGGNGNTITNGSPYSFIGCGNNNVITDGSNNSFIGAGDGNDISSNTKAFIGIGDDSSISNSSSNSFIGAGTSVVITNGSEYNAVLSGAYTTITDVSSYCTVTGGNGTTITNCEGSIVNGNAVITHSDYSSVNGGSNSIVESTYAFIGAGGGCSITNTLDATTDRSSYNAIVNGGGGRILGTDANSYDNVMMNASGTTITDSYMCVTIGSGTITDCEYSGIIGSGNTILNAQGSYAFGGGCYNDGFDYVMIFGGGITATRSNHLYTRGLTLMADREMRLEDRTPNVGDVLTVESIASGDHANVTWGAPAIPTSANDDLPFSHYYINVGGLTQIPDFYVNVHNSEDDSPSGFNKQFSVGTEATIDGYNITDTTLTSLSFMYTTTIPSTPAGIIESNGIAIEDGYEYTIWAHSITTGWSGEYLKQPSTTPTGEYPEVDIYYDGRIRVVRNGSTRTVKMGSKAISGNISSNYLGISDLDFQYNTNDSQDTTTDDGTDGGIEIFTTWNYTTNEVNVGLRNLFQHQSYIKKVAATYDTNASGVVTINWPTSGYDIPTTSDELVFWESDPATNGGVPYVNITSTTSTTVTTDQSRAPSVTGVPCWVYVYGRTPQLSANVTLGISRRSLT